MRNPELKSKNPIKFLGNRRKRFIHSKEKIVVPDGPKLSLKNLPKNIFFKRFREGFFRVKFHCKEKGRLAFGYGPDLETAFENMTKEYNEKYNRHVC